jgi:hypothetical protein
MGFEPDRRFASLRDALAFLLEQQVRRPVERLWVEGPSGVVAPQEVPSRLFRGECGTFETTVSSLHRSTIATLHDGRRLCISDLQTLKELIPDLAASFVRNETYALDEHQAYGLLQHYGVPTTIIDFTGDLTNAFAFAAAGSSTVGRLAVLDLPKALDRVIDFTDHSWAERAQRQAAFGVVLPDGIIDLKSAVARSRLGLCWYEFPVSASDHDFFCCKMQELMRWSDDPSAGFLRYHITEFVEARGKFSPELTDWLLERVPIAPYCYMAETFERKDVVAYFRSAKDLPNYDENTEREHSQRYWSSAFPDCRSEHPLMHFSWRPVGEITHDPRTYHTGPA